jgi:hypothetical protein
MPTPVDLLLRRVIAGDPAAVTEVAARAASEHSPELLVAAAVVTGVRDDRLARALVNATTTRDRQLVALAEAHLAGDAELVDALVRDHLSEHPDNLLAAWIAARQTHPPHQ